MPGHIFQGTCDCGFETKLWPGARDAVGYSICYSADRRDLKTVADNESKQFDLLKIDDPKLEDERLTVPMLEEYWPYLCPQCQKMTMRLIFTGFWD
jgi:hypothetical protein